MAYQIYLYELSKIKKGNHMSTESLYMNTLIAFSQNRQKVETVSVLVNRQITKSTEIYNEILSKNRRD